MITHQSNWTDASVSFQIFCRTCQIEYSAHLLFYTVTSEKRIQSLDKSVTVYRRRHKIIFVCEKMMHDNSSIVLCIKRGCCRNSKVNISLNQNKKKNQLALHTQERRNIRWDKNWFNYYFRTFRSIFENQLNVFCFSNFVASLALQNLKGQGSI